MNSMLKRLMIVGILFAVAYPTSFGLLPSQTTYAGEGDNFCGEDIVGSLGSTTTNLPSGTELVDLESTVPGNTNLGGDMEEPEFGTYYVINRTPSPACGVGKDVVTFTNGSPYPVDHTFSKETSFSTTYSASVGADFATAFKAEVGIEAMHTATDKFEITVEVPTGVTVTLRAGPSLDVYSGEIRCWLCEPQPFHVYRPTGHIRWILQ
ncbi:MAG: hypothetical protein GFH27_549305n24 [Chloroflexi bacterium AL-W]|nr:hypothetical protein [Chloroflexi bacterium AL-N1]NOK69270.1 hypothetical protein [Chloroflexi bacterium AL-N10]NOK76331.1 hypothetical protein [Chloroflexi bacterium AL-N5]NOK83448.1 hypothetical protein [Chloroflexi bacterium AL-W]NOK91108.1 hypothetical protein [Chloroflexi bacterium AL-N15]